MAGPISAVIILNLLIPILVTLDLSSAVQLKLTNLKCEEMDPSFLTYSQCKLKVIRRGVVALNVEVELHQKVLSCMIQTALYKKANGYKPFLYKGGYDFCDFRFHAKANLLYRILDHFVLEYSNANHSCPYEHNIIIKDLILTEDKFRLIPLPTGEYLLTLRFIINDGHKTDVKVYFSRIE